MSSPSIVPEFHDREVYVDGLRVFAFRVHGKSGARLTSVRLPPEFLTRRGWRDSLDEIYRQFVTYDDCGGCGG